MSKSKSKSKSKQATFPDQYWHPEFEIYPYYRGLFDHGKELFEVPVEAPPQGGDVVGQEINDLLEKQRQLNDDANERERRREEIEWEIAHLARSYQTTLLTGSDAYSKTWQLMNTMSDLALVPVMHFKKAFARARPNQLEPRIEPLIEVPGHASYPSGHATQNFLVAHLLSEVIGDDAELIARVFAIARRVAENREYAGLHYASDTRAGEELAREIFPTMRRAFAEPIMKAVEEWQELELEEDKRHAQQKQLVAMPGLQYEASKQWDDPFPGSHFQAHQWNLKNPGRNGGRLGVDINVLGAWQQLGVWQEGAASEKAPVRVALIDLAVNFDHPALARRLDYDAARNLDYPNIPKSTEEVGDERRSAYGWTDEDLKRRYKEAFGSFSSAHTIACAGIIAADALRLKSADSDAEADEPGCLGIAPQCVIVPYRAMTLTEPALQKRQALARAVLQAATGCAFVENRQAGQNGSAARWRVDDRRGRPAHVLLFPLPLEPLPEPREDPLPLALAFAATRIPVIIPSGNKGTSSLSYPAGSDTHVEDLDSPDRLSELFDLELASVHAIFGAPPESNQRSPKESDQQTPQMRDQKILEDLISSLRDPAPIIWVGACNDQGRRSRYSQYGDGLTLVAPSDEVLPSPQEVEDGARRPPSIATTDLKGIGGYMQDQSHYTLSNNEFGFGGTSAAGAQVAGVVALMLEANPHLGPKDVYRILCKEARVKDEQGNNLLLMDDESTPAEWSPEFGHGLVNAAGAVAAARKEQQGAAA